MGRIKFRRKDQRPGRVFRFGAFEFRPDTSELLKHGRKVPLKVQSAKVLGILLQNHGRLVSRRELIEKIWPDRTVEYDLSLNSCLRDIRRALGDLPRNPRFVETLAKRGYRFIGQVQTGQGKSRLFLPLRGKLKAFAVLAVFAGVIVVSGLLYKDTPFQPTGATKAKPPAIGEEARELVLAGVSALYDNEIPETRRALELFEEAARLEPNFTEANLMIARTVFGRGGPEQTPLAFQALERILALEPGHVEALALRGALYWAFAYDYEKAKADFERLLKNDPGFNQAYLSLAGYYSLKGDFETSLSQVDRALSANAIRMTQSGAAGWFYYLAGRYREGLKFCRETYEVQSEKPASHMCFVNNLLGLGDQEGAARYARSYLEASGYSQTRLRELETAPPEEVLQFMFAFESEKPENPAGRFDPALLNQARALIRLKDPSRAMAVLERAYRERNFYLPFISVIPEFETLKNRPDFQALVRSLNLPPNPLNS